jgi:hypothetical protein
VRLVSITVGQDRIEAVTAFDEGEPLRTSSFPGLPDRAMRLLPGLRGHRCDNGAGLTFAREMADTEVAHLLEHIAVELLALSGSPDTLGGRTVWDFRADGRGVFRVLLDFDDDLVAIGALKEAEAILGWLTGARDVGPPDVRPAVARLREARRR